LQKGFFIEKKGRTLPKELLADHGNEYWYGGVWAGWRPSTPAILNWSGSNAETTPRPQIPNGRNNLDQRPQRELLHKAPCTSNPRLVAAVEREALTKGVKGHNKSSCNSEGKVAPTTNTSKQVWRRPKTEPSPPLRKNHRKTTEPTT